jgi:hypothetical protein
MDGLFRVFGDGLWLCAPAPPPFTTVYFAALKNLRTETTSSSASATATTLLFCPVCRSEKKGKKTEYGYAQEMETYYAEHCVTIKTKIGSKRKLPIDICDFFCYF